MSVMLVEPLGQLTQPSGYMRTCYLEPIGVEYLAGFLEARGYNVSIIAGNVTSEDVAAAVVRSKPLVVGFSVHTYVYQESLTLASTAKATAREMGYDIRTVFGGPHPTALPIEVAREPCVDYVVVGEGEEVLGDLLDTLASGYEPSKVAGVVFRGRGELVSTGKRQRTNNLDSLPWPQRSLQCLDRAKQYQIAYPPPSKQVRVAQVMYSRGCPFSCSFCSSENTWGREVVWRSPQAVLDEIEWLVKEFKTNLVYFPDLTFNVDRHRVLALCEEFQRRKPLVHWWALFRADLLDSELLAALRDAGCVKISVGLESPNPDLASNIKGAYDGKQMHICRNLHEADRLGFIIKGFLIIGFPQETGEAIAGYKDRLFDLPIDELRVTFATPFPGTRFFKECVAEGLIDIKPDWSKFTTETPIIRHPSMTIEQLMSLREELVTGFYLDSRYIKHASSKLARFPHLRESWLEYFSFLDGKGVFAKKRDALLALMESLRETSKEDGPIEAEVHSGVLPSLLAEKVRDGESASG